MIQVECVVMNHNYTFLPFFLKKDGLFQEAKLVIQGKETV